MIGIVVATHGNLAAELLSTASLFSSVEESTAYVNFTLNDSTQVLYTELLAAVEKVDQGDGVFIFVDIEGGSPANQASRFIMDRQDVEVISGVNLPMLLTILMERENETLASMKESLLTFSKKSIVSVNDKVRKRLQAHSPVSDMDEEL